jgi:hypothetical protein
MACHRSSRRFDRDRHPRCRHLTSQSAADEAEQENHSLSCFRLEAWVSTVRLNQRQLLTI